MNPAHDFALDVAEGALEDTLQAAQGLPETSLAGAAAERACAALARVGDAVEEAATSG